MSKQDNAELVLFEADLGAKIEALAAEVQHTRTLEKNARKLAGSLAAKLASEERALEELRKSKNQKSRCPHPEKHAFTSFEDAVASMLKATRRTEAIRAYQCKCLYWHLTSSKDREMTAAHKVPTPAQHRLMVEKVQDQVQEQEETSSE